MRRQLQLITMSRRFILQPKHVWRQLRFASTKKTSMLLEKPNPPPGIFGLYLRDNSDEFRSKNIYLNQNELIRLIGDQWKELPDGEREAYRQMYMEQVEKYKQQLISFEDAMSDDERIVQTLKDQNKQLTETEAASKAPIEFPKRPTTAFAFFLKAARESFPKNSMQTTGEWNESMAQKWRDMNEDDKRKFREASKKSYMKFAMERDDKETFSLDEVGGFQR